MTVDSKIQADHPTFDRATMPVGKFASNALVLLYELDREPERPMLWVAETRLQSKDVLKSLTGIIGDSGTAGRPFDGEPELKITHGGSDLRRGLTVLCTLRVPVNTSVDTLAEIDSLMFDAMVRTNKAIDECQAAVDDNLTAVRDRRQNTN